MHDYKTYIILRTFQEKSGPDKNSKFAHDFKTLGDVLIQETVRHDLGKQFPDLAANIRVNVLSTTVISQLFLLVLHSYAICAILDASTFVNIKIFYITCRERKAANSPTPWARPFRSGSVAPRGRPATSWLRSWTVTST